MTARRIIGCRSRHALPHSAEEEEEEEELEEEECLGLRV
jgi:hypothetical protein